MPGPLPFGLSSRRDLHLALAFLVVILAGDLLLGIGTAFLGLLQPSRMSHQSGWPILCALAKGGVSRPARPLPPMPAKRTNSTHPLL